MRAYPLSSLVSLRERRVDEAQNALRLSISRLEEARLSLKRKEQELSDYKVLRKEDYSLDNYPSFIGYSHITASALQSKAVSIFKSLNLAPKISRRKERIFVVVKFINAENNQPASAWVQLIPIGTSDDTIIDFTVTISTEYDEI